MLLLIALPDAAEGLGGPPILACGPALVTGKAVAQIGEQQLGRQPGAAEDDGLHVGLDAGGGEVGGFEGGRPAQAALRVHERRVHQDDMLLPAWGAVALHQGDGLLDQPLRQLLRVGDGGAGEHELGPAAVVGAEPPSRRSTPATWLPKTPAVGVHLVDHHPAQPGQELRPLRVIGQDAHVQHVRIGEHQARRLADPGPVG